MAEHAYADEGEHDGITFYDLHEQFGMQLCEELVELCHDVFVRRIAEEYPREEHEVEGKQCCSHAFPSAASIVLVVVAVIRAPIFMKCCGKAVRHTPDHIVECCAVP